MSLEKDTVARTTERQADTKGAIKSEIKKKAMAKKKGQKGKGKECNNSRRQREWGKK